MQNTPTIFEQTKQTRPNGAEYWSARALAEILGYREYRNFLPVVTKAQEACKTSKNRVQDHFVDIHEMIALGKGAKRQIEDIALSRYACYLIVQNADPSKEIVALGQTYFAIQTRRQELTDSTTYQNLKTENERRLFLRCELADHNKQLADSAANAGVTTPLDYAIFQNHGYKGLYAGLDAQGIHRHKGLKKTEKILDHMGSTELAANLFRATQAEEKLRREGTRGKTAANHVHFVVGQKVRQTIKELGGTMPEDLPVAPTIKEIEPGEKKIRRLPKK